MTDGTVLSASDDELQPGWILALPTDVTAVVADTVSSEPEQHSTTHEATRVVVEEGDNQWTLAEEHLADVLDREVSDAEVAPYWEGVVDVNRDTIESGDPDLIYPGETLELPRPPTPTHGAVADDERAAATDDDTHLSWPLPADAHNPSQVVVEEGDNQWTLAAEHLADVLDREVTDAEVAPYWQDVIDANQDTIESGNPDLIYPGETLELPPPAQSFPNPTAESTADTEAVAETPATPSVDETDAQALTDSTVPEVDEAAAGGVSSVWVEDEVTPYVGWLGAGPDGEIIVEDDDTIEGDVQLWITEEVPVAVTQPGDDPSGLSPAAAAVLTAGGAAAAGWWWRRRRHLEAVDDLPADTPEPASQPAGEIPDELATDLGLWAIGSALAGLRGTPPTPAGAVVSPQLTRVIVPGCGDRTPRGSTSAERLRDMWELPTSALSGRYVTDAAATVPGLLRVGANSEDEMLWVNIEAAGVISIDGAAPHITPLLELFATRLTGRLNTTVLWLGDNPPQGCHQVDVAAVIERLGNTPKTETTALLTRHQGHPQPLVAVIAAQVPTPQRLPLLSAVAGFGPDRGVALITSWPTFEAAPEFAWTMPGYGTLDVPTMVFPLTIDGLPQPTQAAIEIEPRPAPAVELQLLGRPRLIVDNNEASLRRSQSIELLAYLVTHPKGASTDKLLDVLWPDAENQHAKKPTLQQCAAELRRIIGIDHLPRARDGWYHTDVTSDEHRFTTHVTDADTASSDQQRAAHLRRALDLVRGAPYDTVDWLWAITDGRHHRKPATHPRHRPPTHPTRNHPRPLPRRRQHLRPSHRHRPALRPLLGPPHPSRPSRRQPNPPTAPPRATAPHRQRQLAQVGERSTTVDSRRRPARESCWWMTGTGGWRFPEVLPGSDDCGRCVLMSSCCHAAGRWLPSSFVLVSCNYLCDHLVGDLYTTTQSGCNLLSVTALCGES